MPYYVFAIGGTGARCLESLVYLCAMGLGPDQPLHPIIIDPDNGNGNLNRTVELISRYKAIRDHLKNTSAEYFFKTEILYSDVQDKEDTKVRIPNIYNPNSDLTAGMNTLAHFIEYNNQLEGTDSKYLADLLFSPAELNMDMAQGYRGVPSIGSVLMTNVKKQPFWEELIEKLKNDTSSKAFVFASVLGGTGSSGYPVISQLLKREASNSRIGGALVLPYFKLPDPVNLINQQPALRREKVLPNSNSFMINAKAACEFYQNNFSGNDSNYVLGDDLDNCTRYDNYQIGSKEQKNDAHMIELMAAYAAIDFWEKEGSNYKKFYTIQAHNPPEDKDEPTYIFAEDIPHRDKGYPFERFALLYHYINELYDLIEKPAPGLLDKIAWIRDIYVQGNKIRARDLIAYKDKIKPLKELMDSYKVWINQNHNNTAKLDILNSDLDLERLVSTDSSKYSKYHISHMDTKLIHQNYDQNNLLGVMLEVVSQAKITKGGK